VHATELPPDAQRQRADSGDRIGTRHWSRPAWAAGAMMRVDIQGLGAIEVRAGG
jgi:hypothetical protein